MILEGFGEKICKQIDEKLIVFLDEGGVLHEESDPDAEIVSSDQEEPVLTMPKPTNKRAKSSKSPEREAASSKNLSENLSRKESSSKTIDNDEPKKKSKKKAEYVPEFRSGAYAILVTLYNNEMQSKVHFITKFNTFSNPKF